MTLKRVKKQNGGHLDHRECPKFEIFKIKRIEKSRKAFEFFVWRTKARKGETKQNQDKDIFSNLTTSYFMVQVIKNGDGKL